VGDLHIAVAPGEKGGGERGANPLVADLKHEIPNCKLRREGKECCHHPFSLAIPIPEQKKKEKDKIIPSQYLIFLITVLFGARNCPDVRKLSVSVIYHWVDYEGEALALRIPRLQFVSYDR
jgi:hypothetical protein